MIFAMPWIVGLCVFALYPFGASIYYSFTNFSVMLADDLFWKVLRNTLVFAALCIGGGLIISLGLALLMNSVQRGQTIYSAIFYLPHLVPTVVSSIVWLWIFNAQYGLMNGG